MMFRILCVRSVTLLVTSGLAALSGCGTSEEDHAVLVTGVVMDIDRGVPAEGVRVSLFDGSASTDVPTGADGKYTLRVPRGSLFETVVDDFDTGRSDQWFPMINVDYPGIVLDDGLQNALIHACPSPANLDDGSVARWNDYLANCDEPQLPRFDTPSVEASGGVLVVPAPKGSIGGQCVNLQTIEILTSESVFPVGYRDRASYQAGDTCFFYPTGSQVGGLVWSFGASSFPGGDIVVSAIDTDSQRGIVWEDAIVPMVPGTATLLFFGSIELEGTKHFLETWCHCGRELPVGCE